MHEVVKNLKKLTENYTELASTYDDSWDFETKNTYLEKEYDLIKKMEEENKKLDKIKLSNKDIIELLKIVGKFM